MTRIRDLMTTDIEIVSPGHTAREAASCMLRADTGALPVCEDGRLVGMITDRDIVVRGVAAGHGPETAVAKLMSDGVVWARADDEVGAIAQRMSDAQVRRLPVVDANDLLVGMISLGDLSRESEQAAAVQALEGVSASTVVTMQG